jgi:UDP:flavonoid glycosyltransferase YjiC (YdhE family)
VSTILFASEGRSAYCQFDAQLAIANRLRDQGHKILFACSEIETVHETLAGLNHLLVPAPRSLRSESNIKQPSSYERGLLRQGFDDEQTLSAHVHAWRNLFRASRTDIVVADHAPSALLAAATSSLPRLAFGTPFTVPTDVVAEQVSDFRSPIDETPVLARVNAVLAEHRCEPLRRLSGIFAEIPVLLTTFPELDVPRDYECTYLGPIGHREESHIVNWGNIPNRPRVLAQLHSDTPGLQAILQQLRAINGDVICSIFGYDHKVANPIDTFRVITHPIAFNSPLSEASIIVGNGQTECVAWAAKAGIPQVHVTFNAHGKLNADLAAAQGIAIRVDARSAPDASGRAMRETILDGRYRAAARKLEVQCAGYDSDEMVDRATRIVIDTIG